MDKRIVVPEPIDEFMMKAAGFQKSTRLGEWYWFDDETGDQIYVDYRNVVHVVAGWKDGCCSLELSNDTLEALYSLIKLCNCRLILKED